MSTGIRFGFHRFTRLPGTSGREQKRGNEYARDNELTQ
jgi:hypothetical protein